MASHRRPRVFGSSPLRDLTDLRSGFTFWREDVSFEARLSDHIDFQPALDDETFAPCFNASIECACGILQGDQWRGSLSCWSAWGISSTTGSDPACATASSNSPS
jgi:hypothetical protein